MTDVLAEHIDAPTRRHRCVLLDAKRLRCLDCERTLVLPSGAGPTSTSPRPAPHLGDPDACPQHPGEWRDGCRCCRSERIADEQRHIEHHPTADVAAGAAAVREAFARRRRPVTSSDAHTEEAS